MSRLDATLATCKAQGRPMIVPFVTAGFPRADSTVEVVTALAQGGADVVEIGIPFSDPLADGPTIQRASERALANGMSVRGVLAIVRQLRASDATAQLPILLMGYCNPIFRYGLDAFLDDARDAGVDGFIVPDLPPEEAQAYHAGCRERGLAAVFLVAPNAPDERIRKVDELSTHFSYCVTITGVTGARGDVEDQTSDFLRRVRALARKPFVVGFGITSPEHVARLGRLADGVVVGSALIDAIESADDPAQQARELVAGLRAAADGLRPQESR